ncbi:MAG: flagellar capping protein [Clostridia bacterium]|nr:flagellar capping protein [Clostridia bacterium]
MAGIDMLNTVYNHYMTTYAPRGTSSPYDTHKKSELRSVYNSIVKMSKDSPLFLFKNQNNIGEFAVGMKENARELKNVISSLSTGSGSDLLNKKALSSDNEHVVTASYIGKHTTDDDFPELKIEVRSLAANQINEGTYLPNDEVSLAPGTYSFDIHSRDLDYEFQFNINPNETNRMLQEKLSRLINKADIGLSSDIIEDEQGNTAMIMTSDDTGNAESDSLFRISDLNTSKTSGVVDYFGIGEMTQAPHNARFILNGEERSTSSNHFTIDKTLEISLNGISEEGNATTVGLKTDVESFTENISHLIQGYNTFLQKANTYIDAQPNTKRLLHEMGNISLSYKNELDSIGLTVQEDGKIVLDKNLLQQTASEEDALERFHSIKDFSGAILSKSNQVSLDPMHYAEKTIVAYKNPGKSFASPYITSDYSGMLFNSYC